nr:MAG TPA: hypothetical protein [Inoviridae sp.]
MLNFILKNSVNIIIFTIATLIMLKKLAHLLKMLGILIIRHICFV